MKKIGIATITFTKNKDVDFNYGNILQNYALTKFLQKNNYYVETIYYIPTYIESLLKKSNKKEKRKFDQWIDDAKRVIKRKITAKRLNEKKNIRREKFDKFIENNIKYSSTEYEATSDFSTLKNKYDFFITGSDQVWNPYFEGSNEFYYLGFAPKEKRIAYAPSIAVNMIPNELRNQLGEWIKGINDVSIREHETQKMLREEYGINSKLVCDPVFLLDISEWLEKSKCIEKSENYFLVYILGKKTVEMKKNIARLEKVFGVKALDVYNRDDVNSCFAGPEEFLGLINNAKFILTNSFHGMAFSIIFRKDFILLNREGSRDMNSRILNLLELIDKRNRSVQYILDNPDMLHDKYTTEKLDELINESKKFLLKKLS